MLFERTDKKGVLGRVMLFTEAASCLEGSANAEETGPACCSNREPQHKKGIRQLPPQGNFPFKSWQAPTTNSAFADTAQGRFDDSVGQQRVSINEKENIPPCRSRSSVAGGRNLPVLDPQDLRSVLLRPGTSNHSTSRRQQTTSYSALFMAL
jgi:hypothetical protein